MSWSGPRKATSTAQHLVSMQYPVAASSSFAFFSCSLFLARTRSTHTIQLFRVPNAASTRCCRPAGTPPLPSRRAVSAHQCRVRPKRQAPFGPGTSISPHPSFPSLDGLGAPWLTAAFRDYSAHVMGFPAGTRTHRQTTRRSSSRVLSRSVYFLLYA